VEEADGRGRWKRYVENEGRGVTKHEGMEEADGRGMSRMKEEV
jgi:hypothetical protein